MTTRSKVQVYEMLSHAVRIAQELPGASPHRIANTLQNLQIIAASLHRRYEAACSYEWANTDKYIRATERLEGKALVTATAIPGLSLEFQHDPRGWPLILKLNDVELGRLG